MRRAGPAEVDAATRLRATPHNAPSGIAGRTVGRPRNGNPTAVCLQGVRQAPAIVQVVVDCARTFPAFIYDSLPTANA